MTGAALIAVAVRECGRFDVYQLVRLLRHRERGAWPVGARLRFRADLRAAFPAYEVSAVDKAPPLPGFRLARKGEGRVPIRLRVSTPNYCLASELGPMPGPFLEWVRDQPRAGGNAMAAFLDVFNQRIHVLRHEQRARALRALDPALPADTQYAGQLAMLMGVGLPAQREQIPLPMRAWLGLSGMLVDSRKSPAVVERVLSSYLGVACRLRTLVGRWRDLEAGDRHALGRGGHRLGRDLLLGRRTWDARAAVRLDIGGPQLRGLSFDACCALLPLRPARAGEPWPARAHEGLVGMIRLLLDRRFDCEVVLSPDPATLPPAHLRARPRAGAPGLRLGQTAWLGRAPGTVAGRVVRFTVRAFDQDHSA